MLGACADGETTTVTMSETVTISEGQGAPPAADACTQERGDPLPESQSSDSCTDENGNTVYVVPPGEWARGPEIAVRLLGRVELPAEAVQDPEAHVAYALEIENLTSDPTLPGVRYGFYLETAEGARYDQDADAITALDDNVGYLQLNPSDAAEASVIYAFPAAEADSFPGSGAGIRVSGGWSLYLRI